MTKAYYNEHDPKSAAWLRELIKQGHIAPGDVDERSIEDVLPSELVGYTQCHFFAGIGVWSYALRQAGWPDDRPVWTGSCPCQPFSQAGKRSGTADERHLWPAFHWLISQCKPDVVFGEQVASKDGLAWLDTVQSDMEAAGYAIGAVDLCAAGVGAPHIRQRLYFMAESLSQQEQSTTAGRLHAESGERGAVDQLADAESVRSGKGQPDTGRRISGSSEGQGAVVERDRTANQLADAAIERHDGRRSGEASNGPSESERSRNAGILGNAEGSERCVPVREGQCDITESGGAGSTSILDFPISAGSQGHIGDERDGSEPGRNGTDQARPVAEAGPTNGFWRNAKWIYCRDGKWRAVESLSGEMADGVAGDLGLVRVQSYPNDPQQESRLIYAPLISKGQKRVMRLRGYGNAIVAPVAEAFIRAYMDR